jgi:hypothetical protein
MFYFDRGKLWRCSTQIPKKHDENLHLRNIVKAAKLAQDGFSF